MISSGRMRVIVIRVLSKRLMIMVEMWLVRPKYLVSADRFTYVAQLNLRFS
jgi:hypothetical protein